MCCTINKQAICRSSKASDFKKRKKNLKFGLQIFEYFSLLAIGSNISYEIVLHPIAGCWEILDTFFYIELSVQDAVSDLLILAKTQ